MNATRYQVCDGVDNCGDGSDENNMTLCALRGRPCDPYSQFQCANKRCVERAQLCDLKDDCGDSSDELGCHHALTCSHLDKGDAVHLTPHRCSHRFSMIFAHIEIPSGDYKDRTSNRPHRSDKLINLCRQVAASTSART
jgi:hypothetical protein